jgi:hypothetical protein
MSTQILYTCPCCERTGFMLAGLKAHRCHAKSMRRMTPTGPLERPRLSPEEIERAVKKATKNPRP